MLLYIMLYIVLAYLMLFAALTNVVCLYNASFFAIDFCKCFFIIIIIRIKETQHESYLVVIIDNKLNFNQHIDDMSKKLPIC